MHAVLVVEDSEECAATLEIALGANPAISVKVARSAEEAISMLDTMSFAALITDIHLPGMDGLELVAFTRRHVRHGSIPILVISGDSDRDAPDRARAAGASAFFGKPYSPVSVRRTLEALIHAE
jgi:CheY-like chemotaxis protein